MMIGTKEQVREFICDSNRSDWDAYMVDKENITMMDMINFTRSSSTLKFYEAVIWLFRANSINNYDNSFYLDDLYDYIKSENAKNENCLVPNSRLDEIKQTSIEENGFFNTHGITESMAMARVCQCIADHDLEANMKLADFMEGKVNGNN